MYDIIEYLKRSCVKQRVGCRMGNAKILKQISFITIFFVWFSNIGASEKPVVDSEKKLHGAKDSDARILQRNFDFLCSPQEENVRSLCHKTICSLLKKNEKLLEQTCGSARDDYPLIRALQVYGGHCDTLGKIVRIEHRASNGVCIDKEKQKKRFLCAVRQSVAREEDNNVELLLSETCGRAAVERDEKLLNGLVLRCAYDKNLQSSANLLFASVKKIVNTSKMARIILKLPVFPTEWTPLQQQISSRAQIAGLLISAGVPCGLATESAKATQCGCDSCILIRRGKVELPKPLDRTFDAPTMMFGDNPDVTWKWEVGESGDLTCQASMLCASSSSSCSTPSSPSMIKLESNYFADSASSASSTYSSSSLSSSSSSSSS